METYTDIISEKDEVIQESNFDKVMNRLDAIEKSINSVKNGTPTRESILAIKDTSMRLKAIEENAHLFKGMTVGGKVIE